MASATTDRRMGLTGDKGMKAPARVATTANIVLSGLQTIDGVVLVSGDDVLVKNQTNPVDNGIWTASTASWTRRIDANGYQDLARGTIVLVTDGGQAGQFWQITSSNQITIGSSAITWALSLTASSTIMSFLQSGAGAVARTVQDKERDVVNVKDFGADATGAADSTAAFTSANAASLSLWMPAGTFKLTNWQPLNGTVLRGAGYLATFITQGAAAQPAIFINNGNVNWQGLDFDLFTINGAGAASAAAFQVTPGANGAIWRSRFRFCAENTYQAFNVTSAGTNFFDNDVHIQSEGTTTTAVYIQSGTYNRYVLFLTNCGNSVALDHGGIDDDIWAVTDGQIKSSGLDTTIRPKVENLYGTALAAGEACISMTGTNQVLINPSVILPLGAATKCSFAFKPSNGSVFHNPYVTSSGGATLANPFNVNAAFKWALIGGQSNCTNKMETTYDGTSETNSLRNVTMVGDVSQLTANGNTHGGKVTQYLAPAAPFSLDVNPNTDAVVLEPTGAINNPQFNIIYGLVDGRVITITSTQNLTGAINWVSSANVTQLPGTLAAGTPLSFIYRLAQNKFYKV